jgi:hypothetical protein
LEAGYKAAVDQGWYVEIQGDKLVVFHPDGGTLEVNGAGQVEAIGFHGVGCLAAVTAISDVLGVAVESHNKPEYNETHQVVQVAE